MDRAAGDPTGERIRDALTLFNEGHFFEAHELLEDLWHKERGEPRLFLQGLIQICAGFHHLQNGNHRGAAALLGRGSEKMRRYPARYLGLDAGDLLRRVDAAREAIEALPPGGDASRAIEFPRIRMEP